MEMLSLSKEVAFLIALVLFLWVGIRIYKEPTCCDKHGIDCNQGRNCPERRSSENN